MLSYTDLMRISFADAIDEDEATIETMVYNRFTIEQVMAKNWTGVYSEATFKEVADMFTKKNFMHFHKSTILN